MWGMGDGKRLRGGIMGFLYKDYPHGCRETVDNRTDKEIADHLELVDMISKLKVRAKERPGNERTK